jgi:uncharacterized membrane protein YdfJ with MMPL/SSD domain
MGKLSLIGRLVGRDLRRRPGPAVLLVLAITAATATLTLGLVLHGVTNQPYQQTRAETKGPDVVAQIRGFSLSGPGPGSGPPQVGHVSQAQIAAEVRKLTHAPGVTRYSPGAGVDRPAEGDRGHLGAQRRDRAGAHVRRGARGRCR